MRKIARNSDVVTYLKKETLRIERVENSFSARTSDINSCKSFQSSHMQGVCLKLRNAIKVYRGGRVYPRQKRINTRNISRPWRIIRNYSRQQRRVALDIQIDRRHVEQLRHTCVRPASRRNASPRLASHGRDDVPLNAFSEGGRMFVKLSTFRGYRYCTASNKASFVREFLLKNFIYDFSLFFSLCFTHFEE